MVENEFVDAVNFTTSLIRRGLWAAYLHVIEFGDERLTKQASDLLEFSKKYRNREVPSTITDDDKQKAQATINKFVTDVQALEYERRYIHKR